VLAASTPLVVAVSNELNEPRYPTMRAVLDSQRKQVAVWTPADLGLDLADTPRARLQRLYGRDLTRMCEFVDAESPEDGGTLLADLMSDKALV
jgi:electron transfer flavoprotein beta subunit